MRILFGVQGTGNGHITRARIMAKAMAKRSDVEVDFIFSGRDVNGYFDMEVFGEFRTFQGLSFVTKKGCVNYWQTYRALKLSQFYQDVKSLDLARYDLLLNDFEPITAWAAKRQKIPSISLSHQAAFVHPIPMQGAGLMDKILMRYFAPADFKLGIHWYHFGFPILPPFIDDEHIENVKDKSILVYLPFEDVDDIQSALSTFSEYDFVCFHPAIKHAHVNDNIVWHAPAKLPFKAALARCRGVIANAGFEMASECLHFNKSMLLKPLAGQFEQASNANTLADLGLCQLMQTLDLEVIEQWLQFEPSASVQFKSDPNILIDWILRKKWADTQGLCSSLWQQVTFPPSVQTSLRHISLSG
ncbi:glycosyltransferase family protein [Paraglaciecola aquimarina]|uniref:Glycosyltransferase family protein n=1 Tax=Paraglaciecola aquimarina TaxID=1235557 RepID=A0ABU3ST16_9ALTE|nr:MJ1255/VC2487 family glycosyltransferase [Paraglaciecola aquimarina]MDU0353153.1 glycosyltransferase family protein [Paraglaciecola aquimarina]